MDKLSRDERIATLFEMIQAVSVEPDPVLSTRLFVQTLRSAYGNMGMVTIGSRNAPKGHYRLARLLHQPGIENEEYKDREHVPPNLPIYTGGFLGEVMKMEKPRLLEGLHIENDPVLGNQLRPYRSFLVLPVITLGEIGGHVVQFSTDPEAFTPDIAEARFLTASLLGSLTETAPSQAANP